MRGAGVEETMGSVMPMVSLRYQCHPLKDVESAAVDLQMPAPTDLACLVLNVLKEHDIPIAQT